MIENFFFPTKISNNVIIGSNSTILPVNICSGVVIGVGSVVTKNINIRENMLATLQDF